VWRATFVPDAVVCRELRKRYVSSGEATDVLRGLDLTVPAGVLVAIVGPSGSGKSTFLRLLAGIDAPDDGRLAVAGTDLTTISARNRRRFRRERVAYVAQRPSENILRDLRLRAHLARGADVSLLVSLGLGDRLDAPAGTLSGGEQARAGLGLALSHGVPVVVVDEPTAELDDATAVLALDAIRDVVRAGATVVVATHDPAVVAAADVVIELEGHPPLAESSDFARAEHERGLVLVADGLRKQYGETVAVDGLSLELGTGETGVVLGRSGSGKSTLLMLLGGWLAPDQGTIHVDGEPLPLSPGWQSVAYVPQRFGLLPELTIRENIELPFRLRREPAPPSVAKTIALLALEPLANRLPHETSVGQQQRAALARAVASTPRLLLADEPTSHQDRGSAERVWAALAEARAAGVVVLVATHDENAVRHADRVWRLANGRIGIEFDRQPHLVGELLEVRPLAAADLERLYDVARDPLLWELHPERNRWQRERFEAFFVEALASGGSLAVVDRADGRVIGSSRYHDYDEEHREVEIGWTFLARSHWGGLYNAELKHLMLEHAFRYVDSVVFLVASENLRSRRAVEKLGAVEDGGRRESVLYRIVAPR
jgi:ABC-type lipoprotein export system ATPase subunit/RimJ/RimL family protein N-acetyltransferase